MLNHPTLDQLRALKLDGMAEAFSELQQQDAARDLGHLRSASSATFEVGPASLGSRLRRLDRDAVQDGRILTLPASLMPSRRQAPRMALLVRLSPMCAAISFAESLATCRWIADHRSLLVSSRSGVWSRKGKSRRASSCVRLPDDPSRGVEPHRFGVRPVTAADDDPR